MTIDPEKLRQAEAWGEPIWNIVAALKDARWNDDEQIETQAARALIAAWEKAEGGRR